MYDWDVKPSYDGEQIDAIFLSKVNRIDGDIAYVPRDNAVGRGFTLPPGVINPDIEGRFTTALFLPELYKDEQGIIHKVKSKILASVIKSVHLKSQFSPVQLSTWPANVREMFGALVVLNNGRLIYTTQGSFSTLLWVRPAQTRKTEGTMLPAMPTMPLPNQGAMTTTPPTNGGMFDTSVLRNRLAAVLNKN
jgi:hypothetical protein